MKSILNVAKWNRNNLFLKHFYFLQHFLKIFLESLKHFKSFYTHHVTVDGHFET